jgi:hypothetical protein
MKASSIREELGMIPKLSLGAPGIYRIGNEPVAALTGVRMDVCAFLGVAPRGPARVPIFGQEWAPKGCDPGQTVQWSLPVAVESWDAYVSLYSAFEGPGLLPYAVSAFFRNGGKRAYVARVVHPPTLFYAGDIRDVTALAGKLINDPNPSSQSVSQWVWAAFGPATQNVLSDPATTPAKRQSSLLHALNQLLGGGLLYQPAVFANVALRPRTQALRAQNPTGEGLVRLNRLLLEDTYPAEIVKTELAGFALGKLAGLSAIGGREIWLSARNEGEWGNALHASLSFTARPVALAPDDIFTDRIRLPDGFDIEAGSVLRLTLGYGAKAIRRVRLLGEDRNKTAAVRVMWAYFDAPTANAALSVELVEGLLTVDDGVNPTETLDRIGLSSNHSRWLAAVLVNESALLYPADHPSLPDGNPLASWLEADLSVEVSLNGYGTTIFTGGVDRYAEIVPADFFDDTWVPGNECPGNGVHSLVELDDLSLVAVPDLYSPGPLMPVSSIIDPVGFAGAEFAECVPAPAIPIQAEQPEDISGLRLDPIQDLDAICALQRRLTDLADQLESFVVLLDVPPGLSQRRMLHWRGKFASAYCAAYHPWLNMAPQGAPRNRLIAVNPSAIAAGIIAQREIRFGVMFGPANEIADGAVSVLDSLSAARHDELHQHAINVFLPERDGIRLTAGRTLALDQIWRQLNVRRLVTMIRRVLERQMQWAVFEPNNRQLRDGIALALEAYLRQLYRANAFTGDSESQAFFVKCDDELNPPAWADQGRLLAHVGIAPAEPMEFIVLGIVHSADSILTVEA